MKSITNHLPPINELKDDPELLLEAAGVNEPTQHVCLGLLGAHIHPYFLPFSPNSSYISYMVQIQALQGFYNTFPTQSFATG